MAGLGTSSVIPLIIPLIAAQANLPQPKNQEEHKIDISSKELVNILSISRDPSIPTRPILEMLYQRDNSAKLSKNDLRNQLEKLSPEALLDRIKKAAYNDLSSNTLMEEYDNLVSALQSKRFQEIYQAIKESSYSKDISSHALVAYKIYNQYLQSNGSFTLVINLIESPRFAKFLDDLKTRYQINSFDDLDNLLGWYQSPRHIELLKTKKLENLFEVLYQSIPSVEKRQISDLRFIAILNEAPIINLTEVDAASFQEKVKNLNKVLKTFEQSFQAKTSSYEELMRLQKEYPQAQEIKALYQAIERSNPGSFKGSSLVEILNFIAQSIHPIYFKTLKLEKENISSLENAFKKFGITLSALEHLDPTQVEQLYKVGINEDDLVKIFESTAFSDFIQEIEKKWSQAKGNFKVEDIFYLAHCSENQEQFWALNNQLEKLNGSPLKIPETCLLHADLKIEILEKHNELKLSGITIDPPINPIIAHRFGRSGLPLYSEFELESIRKNLQDSEKVKKVYDFFSKNYGIKTFDLTTFHSVISKGDPLRNYDSDYTIEKTKKVKALLTESFANKEAVESSFSDLGFLSRNLRFIEENDSTQLGFDFKEVKNYLPPELSEKIFDDSKNKLDLKALFYAFQNYPSLFEDSINYQAAASILDSGPYNFNDQEIEDYLKYKKDLVATRAMLGDIVVLFSEIKHEHLQASSLECMKVAEVSYNLDLTEDSEKFWALMTFHKMGFSLLRGQNRVYFKEYVLDKNDTSLLDNLNDKEFVQFLTKMIETYYQDDFNPELIKEISDLYKKYDRSTRDQIFSGKFQELFNYISEEFGINFVHPSIFEALLNIHQKDKFEKIKTFVNILRKNGETVFANDLITITELVNNEKVYGTLVNEEDGKLNKNPLLQTVNVYLKLRPDPKERSSKDYFQTLEILKRQAILKKDGTLIAKLERDQEDYLRNYTERPPLKELPFLQLYRIAILFQRLLEPEVKELKKLPKTNPSILDQISEIVIEDLKNQKTELGGQIRIVNGEVVFQTIESLSRTNEAYGNDKYNDFTNGFATFHLHAVKLDSSEFAGPSGAVGLGGGDFSAADVFNGTDIVITTLGHPKGRGDKLLINLDLYFVDKRNSGKKPVIFDFGIYEINFNR